MNDIPIACDLSGSDLSTRRTGILASLGKELTESDELTDGFVFRFPAEDKIIEKIAAIINLERKCCPFLNFRLLVESDTDFVALELTGKEGTKSAVKELFDWN